MFLRDFFYLAIMLLFMGLYSCSVKEKNNVKKSFFQAVSNSSRENYGYLVAIEICDRLNEEMERLNKAFLYWNYRIEIKSI